MKTLLVFAVIALCLIGCQKSNQQDDFIDSQYKQLQLICNTDKNDLKESFGSACLSVNPYETYGILMEDALVAHLSKLDITEIKSNDLRQEIIDLIRSQFPYEKLELSDKGYSKEESEIYGLISNSILLDDNSTLNFRLNIIEDFISKSDLLNPYGKDRVLVFCTAVKHITNCLHYVSSERKSETWEECFKSKLAEKENSGFLEKLRCTLIWVECLGIMAADCLVEQIS